MRKLFTFLLALAASVGASHAAHRGSRGRKLPGVFSVSASKVSNYATLEAAEARYAYLSRLALWGCCLDAL